MRPSPFEQPSTGQKKENASLISFFHELLLYGYFALSFEMHHCAVVEVVVEVLVNEVNVRPPAAILVVDKRRNMTQSLPQFFFFSLAALLQDS